MLNLHPPYDHEAFSELHKQRLDLCLVARHLVDTIYGTKIKWILDNPLLIKLLVQAVYNTEAQSKLVARFCYSLLTPEQRAELDDCPRMYSQLGEMGLVDPDYDGSTSDAGYTECSSWSAMGQLIKEIHDAKCEQECSSRVPKEGTT